MRPSFRGHVNGYSIIKELFEQGIEEIALFDSGRSLARYSNKIKYCAMIDSTPDSLLDELNKLHQTFDYIVLFPTNDTQLEHLYSIYDKVSSFCYMPFNRERLFDSFDKYYQYKTCENIGVPYPKTVSVKLIKDLESIDGLLFPLLIKPSTRTDMSVDVFRTMYIENKSDYLKSKGELSKKIEQGVQFVISEYIPGDDTNMYIYTCFRSQDGDILNEWTGKKLNQYPDNYGVFASASNETVDEVLNQGRALVEALDCFGQVEPEFKYDERDGKYKLMEVSLRPSMPHRIGSLSGVKLHETQFSYATKKLTTSYIQEKLKSIHVVLMLHEIPNLILREGYWRYFKYNVFGGEERNWAIFELRDIKPFLYSLNLLFKVVVKSFLLKLKLKLKLK
ncbi:hypothetical protein VA249_25020 [Vibrio alfacsensis]|uniref:hypothetical protein n=1 Tax=Vibrio alfacsensis TaxID=1074311 RepID=UPI001BEE33A4|nr:hypothetical protein [Vibrio alfacsensis]BBM65856.1 hypothetical protein VA249_25020 [Vibrio alfacsensis]